MDDATTKLREMVELRLNSADHEREHGSRARAERLYEAVVTLMQGLRQAAPLLLHRTYTQLGNTARLNGNFDRSNTAHLHATNLFDELMAGDELSDDEKHQLVVSQVNNLRNHAEEIRKQAVEPEFNVLLRPGALAQAKTLLGDSFALMAQHHLDNSEQGATTQYLGRLRVSDSDVLGGFYLLLIAHNLLTSVRKPNQMWLLYCELDLVEVGCFNGQAWGVVRYAIRDLYTSLRYGNRWPKPLHFMRAVLNLVMCFTPLRWRRKILRHLGRLTSTMPAEYKR